MPLSIENLAVVRGRRTVLDGLTFEIASGEAVVLTGRNGAGKTTLLRAVAGLLAAESGTTRLRLDDGRDAETIAEHCHYIGHLDGLKSSLSVQENTAFWGAYLGGGQTDTDLVLERVGLGDLAHVPARFLSAGQRRRLALARLLVAPRPLWLLDEPTTSLDATGQAMLGMLAAEHLASGGMILAATHMQLPFAGARQVHLAGLATQ
jgi:heme exporter protein A